VTVAAVVTAAGLGTRLGTDLPKALVQVAGTPLVVWAVTRVAEVAPVIVVTVPPGRLAAFDEVLADARASSGAEIVTVEGGATRQESVAAGVEALMARDAPASILLIHDAARAFMPADPMRFAIGAIEAGADGAVPIVPLVDTIVALPDEDGTLGLSVDREMLRAAQTPQAFRARALLDAHRRGADDGGEATDDAGLVRRYGYRVVATEGHPWGFKVTVPGDLVLAEHVARRATAAS
jgi:2-C-methyl-D-erythritol 4-phosphate cytidylyltransferase